MSNLVTSLQNVDRPEKNKNDQKCTGKTEMFWIIQSRKRIFYPLHATERREINWFPQACWKWQEIMGLNCSKKQTSGKTFFNGKDR